MRDVRSMLGSCVVIFIIILLFVCLQKLTMFLIIYLLPALYPTLASGLSASIDIGWHAPNVTWINDLHAVINGTGTHGFVFNSSQLPEGVPYGTYNWCNMPHVRKEGYQVPGREFKLEYVELVS